MGKTATEQMVDILLGCTTTRRSSIKKKCTIHEDIYILGGAQNNMEFSGYQITDDPIVQKFKISENMHPSFTRLKCDIELLASTFTSAYKSVLSLPKQQEVYKWKNNGETYYIGKGIVLDKNKEILMFMDHVLECNGFVCNMNISRKCYDETASKVMKFITGPFLNAFLIVNCGRCRVTIKDMRSRTTDYNTLLKYRDQAFFNHELNKKLHNIMHVTDI